MERNVNIQLGTGFYPLSEAAALLLSAPARLRPWFRSTPRYEPAVRSERVYDGKVADISFLDLMELRFVHHFRIQNVSMQALRRAAEEARETFGEHPFARAGTTFRTDLRKIYAEVATEVGDKHLMSLAGDKQFVLDVIEQDLARGVDFDPHTCIATAWKPQPDTFQGIVLDPKMNFGRPSFQKSGLAVEAIYDAWLAEEGDEGLVARWHDIEPADVRQAVQFKQRFLH
jgi:uncharacterized protein (DUF433 family)